MSTAQLDYFGTTQITRERTIPAVTSRVARADTLASAVGSDTTLWKQAIDHMLGWMSSPHQFEPEDQPSAEILQAAIDFAVDHRDSAEGASAPNSIVPSGSGRIAMQWDHDRGTLVIEFVGPGSAFLTSFDQNGKVERRLPLQRDPRSRRLEARE